MIGLQYAAIREKKDRVLRLTGFTPDEFEALHQLFDVKWASFIRRYTLEGKERKRQVQKERKNAMLPKVEDKLLFLLYSLKNYPTQEALATQFNMEQPHANMWLRVLRPLLSEALAQGGDLPEQTVERLNKAIGSRQSVIIDGVERPFCAQVIQRFKPKSLAVKKRHVVKNVLISGTDERILYVSPTYPGSVHDKTIADEQDIEFQRTIDLLQDTGFQGYKPKNANIIQPLKKPKGKELSQEQKDQNKAKSIKRVVVEHSIRGFKIWRVAKDVCRNWTVELRDYYIFISCGLHNFRLRQRGSFIV